MSGFGDEDHGVFRYAFAHGMRAGFFQAELHPVEGRSGAAEGKDAAGQRRVVPDQSGSDGRGLDFGQRHQAAVFIPGDIGVVQRGEQDADQARNRRWRNDVLLGAGMAEDGHASQIADQIGRDRLDRGRLGA